jgi:E3 ubiquitin-protein ligase SHPRH
LLAERTLLAAHDTREKNKRKTLTSKKAVDDLLEAEAISSITADVELRPEHKVLQNDLDEKRRDILQRSNGRAIKSVMVALNGVAARITNDKDPEKVIVRGATSALRQLLNSQGRFCTFSTCGSVFDHSVFCRKGYGETRSGPQSIPQGF